MSHLYLGILSGTSMDAVDAALVNLEVSHKPKLLATHSKAIDANLCMALSALCQPSADEINRLGQLDIQMAHLFAETILELLQQQQLSPKQINAIGSHGQTVRHRPDASYPFTLQIGDPNTIAALTNITTVADFRRRDMALGGQGAPLVPAFHAALFHSTIENRIILNIGGIANITRLNKANDEPVRGFDTGPGNTLLDVWAAQHIGQAYDHGGAWAAQGTVNTNLLALLLADPYFAQGWPKTTGRELFNLQWLEHKLNQLDQAIMPVDVQATLTELTACSISQAIKHSAPLDATIFVCGGGVKNTFLLQRLQTYLPQQTIMSIAHLGFDPQMIEAMTFAWLAQRTIMNLTGNLPSVTGAQKATILGGIYPA